MSECSRVVEFITSQLPLVMEPQYRGCAFVSNEVDCLSVLEHFKGNPTHDWSVQTQPYCVILYQNDKKFYIYVKDKEDPKSQAVMFRGVQFNQIVQTREARGFTEECRYFEEYLMSRLRSTSLPMYVII